ncbi:SlyX family protein [Chitinibacter sp. S2-10]|uniref:SlyX family protein n=1 Tax=Chitinibacter sp. S2-10 TaxID=3373597 RepID=UPI003977CFAF
MATAASPTARIQAIMTPRAHFAARRRSMMDEPKATEQRIEELEIRLALQDDLLDELNAIIARQQLQIDQLASELRMLQQNQASPDQQSPRSLFDEIPPHY